MGNEPWSVAENEGSVRDEMNQLREALASGIDLEPLNEVLETWLRDVRSAVDLGPLQRALTDIGLKLDEAVASLGTLEPLEAAVAALARRESQIGPVIDALIELRQGTRTLLERAEADAGSSIAGDLRPIYQALADLQANIGRPPDLAPIQAQLTDLRGSIGRPDLGAIETAIGDLVERIDQLQPLGTGGEGLATRLDDLETAVKRSADVTVHMERRLEVELDDVSRKLDALAAALQLAVTTQTVGQASSAGQPASRAEIAARASERISHYRDVLGGIADAVRKDRGQRQSRREPPEIGSGGGR